MKRLQLPVAAAQGMWMRSTIKMAPPTAGPTGGTACPPLRIAVLGESTAAGCGAGRPDDAITGCLARDINARTQWPVHWQEIGQFGATARRIRYWLLPQLAEDLHVAVLLAGGSDVMSRRSPDHWRDNLSVIVDGLTGRADHVVVARIPPFALFSSVPATLGRYLSERAAALDDISRQICAVRPCTSRVTITEVPPPHFFASTVSTCLPPATSDGPRSSRTTSRSEHTGWQT